MEKPRSVKAEPKNNPPAHKSTPGYSDVLAPLLRHILEGQPSMIFSWRASRPFRKPVFRVAGILPARAAAVPPRNAKRKPCFARAGCPRHSRARRPRHFLNGLLGRMNLLQCGSVNCQLSQEALNRIWESCRVEAHVETRITYLCGVSTVRCCKTIR